MSNKKQQLQYVYPPDIQKCNKHRLSMRIFKGIERDQTKQQCQCCQRRVGTTEETGQCCYDNIKLAFLGPGIPLLFAFIKNSIILLVIFCLIYTVFSLYSNVKGGQCFNTGSNCTNSFDVLSIVNKLSESSSLATQNYMLLAFTIIFVFLMQCFRWNFRKIQDQADDVITSPSDYAMILRRLPVDTTRADIQKMVDQKRFSLNPLQRQKTQNLRIVNIVMSYSMTQYKKIREENNQQFYKLLSDQKHAQFKPKQLPKLQKPASFAIIIFSRPQSKQIFRYKPNICQKLLQCIWTPCIPRSNFYVKGERIAIQRAPQPDDIVWQNSKISQKGAICRKTLYSLLSIVVLGIGGAIQYGLAVAQDRSPKDGNTKLIMSSVASIAVSIINAVIQIFLVFTSQKQRNETLTQYNTVLMVKISFFQFLNTGIFVVLANFLANPTKFSLTDGFVFQVTQVMILNAAIPNLTLFILNYCQVSSKIKRCLITRGTLKKSQKDANAQFQGPAAQLPYKYAYVFKTLWLTAFYAPLTPIVVPISAIGLSINYLLQKCLFGRVYSCPNTISSMVNDSAIQLMQYFCLILSLGQYIVYLYFAQFKPETLPLNWSIPIYLSIVISALNLLLPMDSLNRKCLKMPKDSFVYPSYEQVENKFEVTYQMTNPGCQCNRKRKRDMFLLNNLFGGQGNNNMTGLSLLTGGINTGALLSQQNNIYQNNNANQTMNPLNPNNTSFVNPFAAALAGQMNNQPPNQAPNQPQTIEMQPLNQQNPNAPLISPPRLQRENSLDPMNSMVTMQPEKSTQRKQLLSNDQNSNLNNQMLNGLVPPPALPIQPNSINNQSFNKNNGNGNLNSPANFNFQNYTPVNNLTAQPNNFQNNNNPFPFINQPNMFNNMQPNINPIMHQNLNPIMQPNMNSPLNMQPNMTALMQPNIQAINLNVPPHLSRNNINNNPISFSNYFKQTPPPGFIHVPSNPGNPMAPPNIISAAGSVNIAPQSQRSYSSTSQVRRALKFKQQPRN